MLACMSRSAVPWVALGLALGGCAHHRFTSAVPSFATSDPALGGVAQYAVVHVDHVSPGARAGFEDARRVWLGVLAAHHTTDGRGLFLQTGDGGFLSMVPLHHLAELDARRALGKAALADIDPADQHRYDDASDRRLAPPHRSEIWRFDAAESYGATDPMLALSKAAWGKMIVEELDPSPAGDDYDRAWAEVREALAAAHYPLVKVAYASAYGTGNLVTFWLSSSQREFLDAPTMEAAVAGVLGRDASDALFARMRKVVTSSESIDVIPRLDLSSAPLSPPRAPADPPK